MSVLEIILYSVIGVGFVIWLVFTIYDYKHPEKRKKKSKKNSEEQDDLE